MNSPHENAAREEPQTLSFAILVTIEMLYSDLQTSQAFPLCWARVLIHFSRHFGCTVVAQLHALIILPPGSKLKRPTPLVGSKRGITHARLGRSWVFYQIEHRFSSPGGGAASRVASAREAVSGSSTACILACGFARRWTVVGGLQLKEFVFL